MIDELKYPCEVVAKHLKIDIREISHLVDKGLLDCLIIQGQKYITTESLDRYLDECLKNDHQEDNPIHTYIKEIKVWRDPDKFSLLDYLTEELVIIPFLARTKPAVFRDIIDPPLNCGLLWGKEKMMEALYKREEESSTALPNGVALLHPAHPMTNLLGSTFIVLGIEPAPIPFGGGFNNKTDIFFLICSEDRTIHLNIMHTLAHLMQEKNFLDELREAKSAGEARIIIADYEEKLKK